MRHTLMQGDGTRVHAVSVVCTTSTNGAPVSRASSLGVSRNTPFGWPAAAQISLKRNSSRSISVSGRPGVPHRRHAADGKAGARLDERGVGAAHRADDGRHARFVDAPVARGDDQHRPRRRSRRRKTTLLAIWPTPRPARRRLPARCAPPPRASAARADGHVRPAPRPRAGSLPGGSCVVGHVAAAAAARLVSSALPARDTGARPSTPEM